MRRLLKVLAVFILVISLGGGMTGVHAAETYGVKTERFRKAVKAKKIKIKKTKAGKTTLYYDSKLPGKQVKTVKKWIRQLPAKVQKSASRVYFLRKKYYMLTGPKDLKSTLGYMILKNKQIYFYQVSDKEDLRNTIWHEFGHAWDYKKGRFRFSDAKKWVTITATWEGGGDDQHEYYANSFAEYFEYYYEPDLYYIRQTLKNEAG